MSLFSTRYPGRSTVAADLIAFLPKLKKLTLKNVGVWKDLELSFSEKLNFICGEGASGKTTILKALTGGVSNDLANYVSVSYDSPDQTGYVELEFFSNRARACFTCERKIDAPLRTEIPQSMGTRTLAELEAAIGRLTPDYALLFDKDVLGYLDCSKRADVLPLLAGAKGQVIGVLPSVLGSTELQRAGIHARLFTIRSDNSLPNAPRQYITESEV